MPDMEKVINELNDCLENQHISFMDGVGDIYAVSEEVIRNALALLKEQEVKTGHWVSVNDGNTVVIDNDGFPERACYCSECKKYLIASDEYAVYGRYCPFCGAKMEGR